MPEGITAAKLKEWYGDPPLSKYETYRRVATLAGMVVLETPAQPRTHTCYVRADLIREIETALTEAGYDMQAARARYKASLRERSKHPR